MSPEEALAAYRLSLNDVGEDIAIRRMTGTGNPRPYSDTITRARVVGYAPNELVGTIVQGDRKVIALVDNLTNLLPITTNDFVVVGGVQLAIKGVDDNTRRIAGTLVALEIQVRGGPGRKAPSYHASAVQFLLTHLRNPNPITLPSDTATTMLFAGFIGNMPANTGIEFDLLGPLNVIQINTTASATDLSFQFYGGDASGSTIFYSAPVAPGVLNEAGDLVGWHSFAASVNVSTQTVQVYFDRIALDVSGTTWNSSNPIKLHGEAGGAGTGCQFYDLSGLALDASNWIATAGNTFFDLSDVNNLNKLVDASNKPVDWGSDASNVTGAQPLFALVGDKDHFFNNIGSAGSLVDKVITGDHGSNGPGPVSAYGTHVGQAVTSVVGYGTSTDYSADFETTISVDNQIQQTSATDLSGIVVICTAEGNTLTNATTSPSD